MSYIRCLSNPEGLYVFESDEGLEFWWHEKDKQLKVICNPNDFKEFIKKIIKDNHYIPESEPIIYKNISIQDVQVSNYHGKRKIWTHSPSWRLTCSKKYKQYKKKILMWASTWNYFYNNYIRQEDLK